MHDTTNKRRETERDERSRAEDESPPFGGSWRAVYVLVLAWLVVQVVLFYLFTRAFG